MRLTQGTFSFLPDLSDKQIEKQLQYALDNGWGVSIERQERAGRVIAYTTRAYATDKPKGSRYRV
jgi:ribulose bisphosphate carboxylase small subunit